MSTAAEKWVPRRSARGDMELVRVRVPDPDRGEITIAVKAVGMNPHDYLDARGGAPEVGFEVSGVVSAVGSKVSSFRVGDEVLAFRVRGGYTTALNVSERDVFEKPSVLSFASAANLLLVGTAAAEMIHRTKVSAGDIVVVHGASGAVGISTVQQARLLGAHVIGTSSPKNFELLTRFGAQPVQYGPGLEQRIRQITNRVDVAIDTAGTDEAIDVSLDLVQDRQRIASSAAFDRADADGFWIAGYEYDSVAYRDSARAGLVALAHNQQLVVPVARTFPFNEVNDALNLVGTGHAGGKVALIV